MAQQRQPDDQGARGAAPARRARRARDLRRQIRQDHGALDCRERRALWIQCAWRSYELIAPASGYHYLQVYMDTYGTVAESNESNQNNIHTFSVQ
jgi:hypothetical protein